MFVRSLRHARSVLLRDLKVSSLTGAGSCENSNFVRKKSSDIKDDSDTQQQDNTWTKEERSADTQSYINRSVTQPSSEASDEAARLEEEQHNRKLQMMSLEFIASVDEASLSPQQLAIHKAHVDALKAGDKFYKDPLTGYDIMSRLAHLHRGDCCGNACRHCPFGMKNVPPEVQQRRIYNSAFYEEAAL